MNEDIKREVAANGLRLWQVAERLGISDHSFSRKLRRELPDELKVEIRRIICELESEGKRT